MSVPVAILMDRPNGFRSAVLLSTLVVLLGCILRLLARDSTFTSVILLHFSYALNALAGPIAVSAPSLLANAWFPANERGLATGIAVASNTFGLVCSYFCGPLFVAAGTMGNLMTYMYVCLALSAANGLGILLHFPSSPALPPAAVLDCTPWQIKRKKTLSSTGFHWQTIQSFELQSKIVIWVL